MIKNIRVKKLLLVAIVIFILLVVCIVVYVTKNKMVNSNEIDIKDIKNIVIYNEEGVLLNLEETKIILKIINDLKFSEETYDGLADYAIIINGLKEENNMFYAIALDSNSCCIISVEGKIATLTQSQTNDILKIINKYGKI